MSILSTVQRRKKIYRLVISCLGNALSFIGDFEILFFMKYRQDQINFLLQVFFLLNCYPFFTEKRNNSFDTYLNDVKSRKNILKIYNFLFLMIF